MDETHRIILNRRALLRGGAAGLGALAGLSSTAAWADSASATPNYHAVAKSPAFQTTLDYVTQFYPLWFTYHQSLIAGTHRLVGPVRVSPLYQTVVAINVDTIYASSFLSLTDQPLILTIPPTSATYSVLTLDPYGNVFDKNIKAEGTYALMAPGYTGPLPPEAIPVEMPWSAVIMIFRADKYSEYGENQIREARAFRRHLRLRTRDEYNANHDSGRALVVPEAAFAIPFKTVADDLIARAPLTFLKQLQIAVSSSNTPPLSPEAEALVAEFDALFGDGNVGSDAPAFRVGAQRAHELILDNYLSNRGPTNWIHFTSIGDWGDNFLDRASITEFIQFGNDIDTASYYHAFRDIHGVPLNGKRKRGYILKFKKDEIPQAQRFWSLTAYTPDSIELIENPANKYVVARYTPGLVYNEDGSLSIYMATELPPGVPMANWLPVAEKPFNIMLRIYGPVSGDEDYVPPAIQRF